MMKINQPITTIKRLGGALELSNHRVVIRLPHPKLFQMVVRTAILALVLLSFPWILSTIRQTSTVGSPSHGAGAADDLSFLADLNRLGLLRATAATRTLFLGAATTAAETDSLLSNRIEQVDADRKAEVQDSTVDFLLFDRTVDFEFVDRVLKPGGIVAVRLSSDIADRFVLSPNFKIVYISRSDSSTVVAVRKLGSRRNLLSVPESKKKALNELEDAVLEPPTRRKYRQKTKYLPEVMEGSLSEYPRRVFVDVEAAGSGGRSRSRSRSRSERWFAEEYPKQGTEFEVVRVEGEGGEGMNEWLKRNVRGEEYVVMKAEAGVVEEMVKGKVIGLVDELFLECRNQWMRGNKSKRAYWECLALYGRLKDEGVAVHQWWD